MLLLCYMERKKGLQNLKTKTKQNKILGDCKKYLKMRCC